MKVIVINGASSAGCTSFVREFAEQTGDYCEPAYIDKFTYSLPEGMWERCCDTDEGWAEIGTAFNKHLAFLAQNEKIVVADAFYKLRWPVENLFKLMGRERIFLYNCIAILLNLNAVKQPVVTAARDWRGVSLKMYTHLMIMI